MCPFEYDQVYECTRVISSMEFEDLKAVTAKINIFNTKKTKSDAPVCTILTLCRNLLSPSKEV